MDFNPFWMVLGEGTPIVKHGTEAKARAEAERLAKMCPGKMFYVLEAIARCQKTDVVWGRASDAISDEIPF